MKLLLLVLISMPALARTNFDACRAVLPGFNMAIAFDKDGKLAAERGGFLEKRVGRGPDSWEYVFTTTNRAYLPKPSHTQEIAPPSESEKPDESAPSNTSKRLLTSSSLDIVEIETNKQDPFVKEDLLTSLKSRDVLTVRRDPQGRVIEASVRTESPDVKSRSFLQTDSGWVSSPTHHMLLFRYEDGKCMKTVRILTDETDQQHVLYSEPLCDRLFPAIEANARAKSKDGLNRLNALFDKLEAELQAERKARRQTLAHLGHREKFETAEQRQTRIVNFARTCQEERGGLSVWDRVRKTFQRVKSGSVPKKTD